MPQRKKARSEGVQIRLDPELKKEARIYLELADLTWQDLLEQSVRNFVRTARAKHRGKALQDLTTS
jgi:hypothetical protein